MKLFKNVKGMFATKLSNFPQVRMFDVRITNDQIGTTLSITDNKTQFIIPITEEMKKEINKND